MKISKRFIPFFLFFTLLGVGFMFLNATIAAPESAKAIDDLALFEKIQSQFELDKVLTVTGHYTAEKGHHYVVQSIKGQADYHFEISVSEEEYRGNFFRCGCEDYARTVSSHVLPIPFKCTFPCDY